MLIAYIPLLVAILGLLITLLGPPPSHECGRAMMWTGILVTLMTVADKTLRLG